MEITFDKLAEAREKNEELLKLEGEASEAIILARMNSEDEVSVTRKNGETQIVTQKMLWDEVWALGADSLRVISGAEDRMVKVWDARSGRCQRTFTGHAGPVTCVCLGDSRMVTGSEDCEVRLYSFRTEDHPDQTNPLGTAGDSNPSVA